MTTDELREWLADTSEPDRSPAMVLLAEELIEREWSTGDLAAYMGGDEKERSLNGLALDLSFACAADRGVILTEEWSQQIQAGLNPDGSIWARLHEDWRSGRRRPLEQS